MIAATRLGLSDRRRRICSLACWFCTLFPISAQFSGQSQVKISPRRQSCQPLAGVRERGHWKESADLRRSTRLVWRIPLPAALPFAGQARKARSLFAGRISRLQLHDTSTPARFPFALLYTLAAHSSTLWSRTLLSPVVRTLRSMPLLRQLDQRAPMMRAFAW